MTTNTIASTPTSTSIEAKLETTIITPLVDVTKHLRRAARLSHREECVQEILAVRRQVEEFLALQASLLLQMTAVKQWLIEISTELDALVAFNEPLDELQQRAGAISYLIEMIPSQIWASIEQGRIDRKEAPSRFDFLNALLAQRGGTSYLEIGCCSDDCFSQVRCAQRVGVDPASGGTLRMTSDEFFAVNVQRFDLIFIDGLHEAWQVDRDIENALRWLNPNGVIVMHDCNPLFDIRTLVPRASETWNGDTWKSLVRVRSRPELDCATGLFDHGCGVIVPRANSAPLATIPESALTWDNLSNLRSEWLRPMEYADLLRWVAGSKPSIALTSN